MARHPFDPVSLVFGALAVAAGLVVLTGGSLTDEARFLLPAGLIALGVALLAKVGGARRELGPATSAGPAVPRPLDDRDIDDLLAPMDDDDLLARWDAEQAAARARGTDEALVAPVATEAPAAPPTSDDTLALAAPDDTPADDTEADSEPPDTDDDTVADGEDDPDGRSPESRA